MRRRLVPALLLVLSTAATAPAQTPRVLTLDEALVLAGATSESVAIAEAAVARAEGDRMRARGLTKPQLSASASYDRALASEFSGIFDSAGPPCPPLDIDATRPLSDRVAEIERALDCGAIGGFSFGGGEGEDDDGALPFGQANTWRAGLVFTQGLYSGGRVGAARALATASYAVAEVGIDTARAQLALDVTRTFYDAALADRLVTIAEASHAQADALYAQTRQLFETGSRPEFELLRAQVARDNQLPVVIRARSAREIAYLRLRQLLDLPPGTPLQLEAGLTDPALPPPAPYRAALAARMEPSEPAEPATRATVRQAEGAVAVNEASVDLAKAQRMPALSLVSNLQEVAYPSGIFPSDWRTNWTVGASLTVPILTGDRLAADIAVAAADLAAARARLQQARELSALDAETAKQELIAAEAAWNAGAGTVAQARRAYEIAELRYREGISTQLELADSRLALESAEANRAQAARDVQVARARIALLPNLPLPLTGR